MLPIKFRPKGGFRSVRSSGAGLRSRRDLKLEVRLSRVLNREIELRFRSVLVMER